MLSSHSLTFVDGSLSPPWFDIAGVKAQIGMNSSGSLKGKGLLSDILVGNKN